MQLFLDCDGVLANFDKGAEAALGMPPKAFEQRHGLGRFWARLHRTPDFYARLEELPDARELFDGVKHLNPVILTGCPRGGWAEDQKVRWADEHFPGTRIITCMARDKRDHGQRGDILIDDTLRHRERWEETCGVFIHHRNARQSLAALKRLHPELF
jgi:5'(3')-deoxyribonucleotidase